MPGLLDDLEGSCTEEGNSRKQGYSPERSGSMLAMKFLAGYDLLPFDVGQMGKRKGSISCHEWSGNGKWRRAVYKG